MYKFLTSITAAAAIHDDVINLRPRNLQEAVGYVESHSKGGSSLSIDRSQLRCSNCRGIGHTAKTCRRKSAKTNSQRPKKVDEVEVDAQVEACDEDGSWGEPEDQDVDCVSQDELDDSLDMFPAEIEDLGKRKGTNEARDNIVKKLRETPPNADAAMGGYKSIPV